MMSSYEEQCSLTWAPGTEACRRMASEWVKSEKPRIIFDWKIDRHYPNCKPLLHHNWNLTLVPDWLEQVPGSCCGSHDIRMCVFVCWRWPSVRTGCKHEPGMDPKLQTGALWGTEQHHEQFDSHVPSHQNGDRHHCEWHKSVNNNLNDHSDSSAMQLTVIVPPSAACWGSGPGPGPLNEFYHPPCVLDADNKLDQWKSVKLVFSQWSRCTEPDHRSMSIKHSWAERSTWSIDKRDFSKRWFWRL